MRHLSKLSSILALGWLLCCLPVSAQTRLATASLHQETKPARLSKDQKGQTAGRIESRIQNQAALFPKTDQSRNGGQGRK